MISATQKQLAHVLWLGGATDAGKSTVARNLAQRYGITVYHYDRADAAQMEHLAHTVPAVKQFLNASLEERWVQPTPQMLFDFLLRVFPHRFQLVVAHLLEQPNDKPILVEGFGLLPELVHPVLSSPHQALWFAPTEQFKWDSMTRRGKPSFAASLSDPERAKQNLFARDMRLANYYRAQVARYGYTLLNVDGSQSVETMTDLADAHFANYLVTL